jgi:tRNA pseudouridine55 synthase
MSKRFVIIDKEIGETPLMAIEKWKAQHPEYKETPASYAGRLDPMASGKLLILLGDECKRQAAYTGLDKEYEIEVLFELGSDTGDILGLATYQEATGPIEDTRIRDVLNKEIGTHSRAYPIFSSKTVAGQPLFLYALSGTLSTIDIPEHIERIYNIKNLERSLLPSTKLQERITAQLARVPRTSEPSKRLGEDFRVDAVRAGWDTIFTRVPEREFTVLRLRVTVASGAYMRSLAARIGESLGTAGLALSIKRTKIGTYLPFLGSGLWLHTY